MMMIDLAKATANVDVWVVASNQMQGRGPGGGPGGGAPGAAPGGRPGGGNNRPQGPGQRHSTMANLACYPAINVPNGFNDTGSPTNVTFFARPYGEGPMLALARAYQDAAGFHLRRPQKLDTAATAG
jgi:Asp-tRNA(Asn)/Glu-tRNA(Gln) amidotransferase A subunit family amidase